MIEKIRNALGISCVEIYLLALFETCDVDCNEIFLESFIPMSRVISDFAARGGESFAAYTGLERVQDVAVRKGIAEISGLRNSAEREFQYYLYRVKPEYKIAGLRPWRHDHFLLAYQNEFYDCYPPSKVAATEDIFTGFRLGVNISEGDSVRDSAVQYEVLKEILQKTPYQKTSFQVLEKNLRLLRDALLILKISRRRINRILQSEFLNDWIDEAGRVAGMIEASRLRHRETDFGPVLLKLCESEEKWMEEVIHKERKNGR